MALWVCSGTDGCGTKYAVGLFRCPRCHNNEFHEDGDPMAKISRHSGASVAEPEPADDTAPAAEPEPQPEPVPDEAPEVEGGEGSSPGSSSSASTEPQPTSFEPSSKQTPKRARKTASRSAPDRTESSSAPSTDGGQTEATSASDET